MNRKEMLVTIATQSGCSLRHIRKVIFNRAAENKAIHPHIKFYEALLDHDTNWIDRETLNGQEKFRTNNTFEVCHFPSGYVVLFYVKNDDEFYPDTYGARLTTSHHWSDKFSR